MAEADGRALSRGDWDIRFEEGYASVSLLHRPTGFVLAGDVSFRCGSDAWSIGPSRDGLPDRPSLVDTAGDVQGYLLPEGAGDTVALRVIHRAAQNRPGELRLEGSFAFGPRAFACRVNPPAEVKVVRLASGPVDCPLNDAVFDPDADRALYVSGAGATIATLLQDGPEPCFRVTVTATPHKPDKAALAVSLTPDFYRNRYVPYYRPLDRNRCPHPPTGWMSWNSYFDQAGTRENLAEARVAVEHLLPFGLEYWSIESWQENSDRLPVRDFYSLNLRPHRGQFPGGMADLAEEIRRLGFRPGIWTVPFGTGNSAFYEANRRLFLHDADGNPFGNWCGRYVLDPTVPESLDLMREMHRVMAEEWGYEFFKIDGMSGRSRSYSAHFYEREDVRKAFANPVDRPFAACVRALREGIGPKSVFLACQGHYSGPEAGEADAARSGADIVHPGKPPAWENVRHQALTTLNQLFAHGIVFHLDPDTLMVGEFLGLEQARVSTTVVALPGQVTFFGDKLGELPEARMKMLKQTLPVCDVIPLDLYPVFDPCAVWDLKIVRPFESWDVVALFNWNDTPRDAQVTFADLGLKSDAYYLLYEMWEDRLRAPVRRAFSLTLPARGVRVLAIREADDGPRLVGTDRHVTQGGVSIDDIRRDETGNVLTLDVRLVAEHPTTYVFHVPRGLRHESSDATGGVRVRAHRRGSDRVDVVLLAETTGPVALTVRFGPEEESPSTPA